MSSSTEQFYKDCMIYVNRELETSGEEGDNCENIFTRKIISDLSSGNSPVVRGYDDSVFRYESSSSNSKINAFHLDDVEKDIIVYVTFFSQEPELYRLGATDVDAYLRKLSNFMKMIEQSQDTLLSSIEEEHPLYSLVYELKSHSNEYDSVNYVLLTNGKVGEIKLPAFRLFGKKVNVSVYDIERYKRFIDGQTVEEIIADLDILGHPLKCTHLRIADNRYEVYSCIFSGNVIYRLFDEFHFRLLNSNVRTYLQLRGDVNKEIMRTITTSPEKFLAYNNGISATASRVDTDDNGDIISISDLQIVNGGQTSVSIYKAKSDSNANLDNVYVLAKITVINNPDIYKEMVKNISRYANTQNKIKISDLSSNDAYNIELAKLSRTIYTPAIGTKLPTKWFYENIDGAYNIEASENGNSFKREYPETQKIKKTDLSTIELSYQGLPYLACKGAEDGYKVFAQNLPDLSMPDEETFKQLIAKKILYDKTLAIIGEEGYGQGKKSMTAYVVAYLSAVVCKNKLNLKDIWNNQAISDDLSADIHNLVRKMCPYIREHAIRAQKSIEMYTKPLATWQEIKSIDFNCCNFYSYIGTEALKPILTNTKISNAIAKTLLLVSKEDWIQMSKQCNLIEKSKEGIRSDRSMCISMLTTSLEELSEKQVAYALRLIYKFYSVGFVFADNSSVKKVVDANRSEFNSLLKLRLRTLSTEKYFKPEAS